MIFISLSVLVAVVIWRNRSQMSQVETQKKDRASNTFILYAKKVLVISTL